MVSKENQFKKEILIEALANSLAEFRNGDNKALIRLEQLMSDIIGIKETEKIMTFIRTNIMDISNIDIISAVKEKLDKVIENGN